MPTRRKELALPYATGGRGAPVVALGDDASLRTIESIPARDEAQGVAHTPPLDLRPRVGAVVRQVAMQRGSRDVSRIISQLLPELIDADRVRCYYYEATSNELWYEADDPEHDIESTGTGVVGYAARARVCSRLDRASSDPRYDATIDDPTGDGNERLLVEPVVGSDGVVHGVLVASRGAKGPRFTQPEADLLRMFAARCGPLFDALSWEVGALDADDVDESIFRAEALSAYKSRGRRGDVVRVYSSWVRACYWLITLFFVAASVYAVLARVDEFATGQAVVMSDARMDVAPAVGGQLGEVLVRPGETVRAGQVLARLRDGEATEELQALNDQFEMRLVDRLLNPDDRGAEQALVQVAVQRDRASRALGRRELRAPGDGVVGEIFIEAGEPVAAGEPIISIVAGEERMELLAAIPAGFRPLIRPGAVARVQLVGHPGEYLELRVREISEEAFGPTAARRKLGRLLGDAVPVAGTVIFVRFDLPPGGLEIKDRRYSFHHGMQAMVDIRVRSERVATVLVPGLKELFGSDY